MTLEAIESMLEKEYDRYDGLRNLLIGSKNVEEINRCIELCEIKIAHLLKQYEIAAKLIIVYKQNR